MQQYSDLKIAIIDLSDIRFLSVVKESEIVSSCITMTPIPNKDYKQLNLNNLIQVSTGFSSALKKGKPKLYKSTMCLEAPEDCSLKWMNWEDKLYWISNIFRNTPNLFWEVNNINPKKIIKNNVIEVDKDNLIESCKCDTYV